MESRQWHASITLERLLLVVLCFVLLAYHTGSRTSPSPFYQARPNADCRLAALRGRWERVTADDIR